MQTKKIALVSTMLVGLGGAALAQQATDPAQDPLLQQQQQGETMQQTPEAAGDDPAATDPGMAADDDPLAPEEGVAADDDPAATDPGLAADDDPTVTDPGIAADDDPAATDPGLAADDDPTATDPAIAADEPPLRSPSVADATEPYTATVFNGLTADEVIGMTVVDANGDNVGSISDLLIGADNTVDRAIIDVGGFLGFGAKPVAIELARLNIVPGEDQVVTDATRDELDAMPEWQHDEEGWFTE